MSARASDPSPTAVVAMAAEDDRFARAAWSCLAEPGDTRSTRLLQDLGPARAVAAAMTGRAGARHLAPRVEGLDPRRELRVLASVGGRVVVPGDEEWPSGVDHLEDVPACLWVRGPLGLRSLERSVALVGARAATEYGVHVARELAAGVAMRGWGVVSGGAYGIDAACHRGALAVGGRTAAVLACGVDSAYPKGNTELLRVVAERGVVVSELPPGRQPSRTRFLSRNRLIAALSAGAVVVEAASRSGALSTARYASLLGLPLGAVPGPVTSPASHGCHDLLRDGATCVTRAEEVLDLVAPVGEHVAGRRPAPAHPLDDLEDALVLLADALPAVEWAAPESVARWACMPAEQVVARLPELATRGLAEERGGRWRRRR